MKLVEIITLRQLAALEQALGRRGLLRGLLGTAASSSTAQAKRTAATEPKHHTSAKTLDGDKLQKSTDSTAVSADRRREQAIAGAAQAAGITGRELAAFLAQLATETGGFLHLEERGNPNEWNQKYGPEGNAAVAQILGNSLPGDGALFHGRGLIQLTGRSNYNRHAGFILGKSGKWTEKTAGKLSDMSTATTVAIDFWKTRVRPRVNNWDDVAAVTKAVNGGQRGLEDRLKNYAWYKAQMKL